MKRPPTRTPLPVGVRRKKTDHWTADDEELLQAGVWRYADPDHKPTYLARVAERRRLSVDELWNTIPERFGGTVADERDEKKENDMSSTKTSPIQRFKALDDKTGEFEAVVSIYGTIDLQGDVTMAGAHTASIKKWRESGKLVPVVWSHDWSNPFAHIGYVDPADMREIIRGEKGLDRRVEGGLFVKGHLDVDKPFAKQVYDLLKEGRVKEWSWAYDVVRERRASDGANELLEVNIFEVGPTLKGAHPDTLTLAVKGSAPPASELAYHLYLLHGARQATLRVLTANQARDLHRQLHAEGEMRVPHGVNDRKSEDDWPVDPEREALNAARRELGLYNEAIDEAAALRRKSETDPDRVDAFIAEVRAERAAAESVEAAQALAMEMTRGTPAGDAPLVGPDMQQLEEDSWVESIGERVTFEIGPDGELRDA